MRDEEEGISGGQVTRATAEFLVEGEEEAPKEEEVLTRLFTGGGADLLVDEGGEPLGEEAGNFTWGREGRIEGGKEGRVNIYLVMHLI